MRGGHLVEIRVNAAETGPCLTDVAACGILNRMVEHRQGLDAVFAAVADPTRRAILATLARKPATVTEIARPFPVSLNAISKHLMVLERAGLIRRKVIGREHHCSIEPRRLQEAAAWFDHYRTFWEERLDSLERHLGARATGALKASQDEQGASVVRPRRSHF